MPFTIAEVDKLFAAGAESVTLTRAEWEAIQEISKGYFANRVEVSKAKREVDRVQRISRPVWRARKVVASHAISLIQVKRTVAAPSSLMHETQIQHLVVANGTILGQRRQ